MKNIHKIGEKIYITSDEEIKEGDWCINIYRNKNEIFKNINLESTEFVKKIILTDNKDLIKDDIQAIDDEFLEWFVKNPSCEWVEIEEESNTVEVSNMFYTEYNYKTIIPKEDTKQLSREEIYIKKEFPKNKPTKKGYYITDYNGNFENSEVKWFGEDGKNGWCFINSSCGIIDKKITWFMERVEHNEKQIIPKEETKEDCNHDMVIKYGVAECQNCGMEENEIVKKETIEEACNRYYEDNIDNSNIEREHYEFEIKDLMIGFAYKWQVERLYSEEDMKLAFEMGYRSNNFIESTADDSINYIKNRKKK